MLFILFIAGLLNARIGLMTRFADIILEDLKPGKIYNLRLEKNLPYIVTNAGDDSADVVVEVEVPAKETLKEGYQPLPDISWIKIIPNKFTLPPGQQSSSDIILQIPDDDTIVNKSFQVSIWAHTVGTGILAAGVKSRLRFSIGKAPQTVSKEKKSKKMINVDVDMYPYEIFLKNIPVEEKYDVDKKNNISLILTNRSKDPITIKLNVIEYLPNFPLPSNFEISKKLDSIILKPDNLKLKGLQTKQVKIYLNIPKEDKEKNLAFLVKGELYDNRLILPIELFTKIFLETK